MSATSHTSVPPKRTGKKTTVVTRGMDSARGEKWIVGRAGAAKTIITSLSSAKAMDHTSVVYAETLKRLAEK